MQVSKGASRLPAGHLEGSMRTREFGIPLVALGLVGVFGRVVRVFLSERRRRYRRVLAVEFGLVGGLVARVAYGAVVALVGLAFSAVLGRF